MSSVFDKAKEAGGRQFGGVICYHSLDKGDWLAAQSIKGSGKTENGRSRTDAPLQTVALIVGVLTFLVSVLSLTPLYHLVSTEGGRVLTSVSAIVIVYGLKSFRGWLRK